MRKRWKRERGKRRALQSISERCITGREGERGIHIEAAKKVAHFRKANQSLEWL